MSLLRSSGLENALKAVELRRARRQEVLSRAMFGGDGSEVPAGMVKLEGDDADLFLRHLQQRSEREQEDIVEGDAATQATAVPAVREEIAALEQQ